jgi:K+-sensing histidine kinase KdpD
VLCRAKRYSGTGLGLSVCKKLVQLMGGHISVTSARGQGSAFSFQVCVPLVSDAREDPSHFAPLASTPTRSARIRR